MGTYSPAQRLIPLIAFWLYALLLVVVSLLPNRGFTQALLEGHLLIRADYLLHALAFLLLTLLAHLAAKRQGRGGHRWSIWGVVVLLAVGMEFIQLTSPCRTFNPLDLLSNGVGVAVALGLVLAFGPRRRPPAGPGG